MCRNFSIFSTCFRDMSIASTCCMRENRASATISAKGGLNIVLNSRSGFFKISIEMPLIGLMASMRAIVDLNNVPQGHTMLNKIGRIRTRQHQSITDSMVMKYRNFSIFSTRFWDMSIASTCCELGLKNDERVEGKLIPYFCFL